MEPENDSLSSGMSMQEYLLILKRRRAIILQAFVLVTVVGIIVTLMSKPVYQASAKLLVEASAVNVSTVDTSNPLSSLFELNQAQSIDTQIAVLQTGPLLDQVMRQVGPADLKVAQVDQTNIIEVDSEAGDPKIAAAAPNALLNLYITKVSDADLQDLVSARVFVQQQESAAQQRLASAEQALKNFQNTNHVSDFAQNRSEQAQRVSVLVSTLQGLHGQLVANAAQIAADQHLINLQPAELMVQAQSTNTLINNLRDQIGDLEVERAGMTQPGGDTAQAPAVEALDGRLAAIRARLAQQPLLMSSQSGGPNPIRETLKTGIINLESQDAPIEAQIKTDTVNLAQARAALSHYPEWEITLNHLSGAQTQAAADVKTFSQQLADLSLREQARHPDARIIEEAVVPTSPVRPKKLQGILFSCLIGLFIGICLALLQEFLDDRINTVEDADRTLGLPNLGRVPSITATDARLLPQMRGVDPAAEAYRILRTNIHFATVDMPAKTIVVTSSRPGEGKSTTAANLAFAMALDGHKVVIVDSDLRRPSLHKLLSIPNVPGLTDVLVGDAKLEDVLLEHQSLPGLRALSSGSTPPNPSELLGSQRFRALVEELKGLSDIVIFDSPPVLAAADAQILASQMSGVVMVIETGETRKMEARQTVSILRQAHATMLGLVYNKANMLGESGYYYYGYHTTPALEAAAANPGFRPFAADPALGALPVWKESRHDEPAAAAEETEAASAPTKEERQ